MQLVEGLLHNALEHAGLRCRAPAAACALLGPGVLGVLDPARNFPIRTRTAALLMLRATTQSASATLHLGPFVVRYAAPQIWPNFK